MELIVSKCSLFFSYFEFIIIQFCLYYLKFFWRNMDQKKSQENPVCFFFLIFLIDNNGLPYKVPALQTVNASWGVRKCTSPISDQQVAAEKSSKCFIQSVLNVVKQWVWLRFPLICCCDRACPLLNLPPWLVTDADTWLARPCCINVCLQGFLP